MNLKLALSLLIVIFSICNSHDYNKLLQIEENLSRPDWEIFSEWHTLFTKGSEYSLNSSEGLQRFEAFSSKLKEIRIHNAKGLSWTKGLNQYSDRFKHESLKKQNPKFSVFKDVYPDKDAKLIVKDFQIFESWDKDWELKKTIDWSAQTGRVFNQGACGSCYIFATLNAIESNFYIQHKLQVTLSRQQVLDCNPLGKGCDGGGERGVSFYSNVAGLTSEYNYPYQIKQGTCELSKIRYPSKYLNAMDISGYRNGDALYKLLKSGPVVSGLDIDVIDQYRGGLVKLENCVEINHAILIVGMGYDIKTKKSYWIVKNQWAETWGEKGYGRFEIHEDSNYNCFLHLEFFRPYLRNS